MSAKKMVSLLICCLLIGLSACSPYFSPPTVNTLNPDQMTAAVQTRVAEIVSGTLSAQTQVAGMTASAIGLQTEVANSVALTLTAIVTDTPEFTFTPSLTPTITPSPTRTYTPTFNFPRVTAGADTNCRTGPSTAYNILGQIKAGQTAEIVGQDADRSHWVIRLPSDPTVICWIWRASATITGNTAPVPVFTPQPTPTETIGFILTFDGFASCGGLFAVKFKIVNNSQVTWESDQVNATDRTTNVTTTIDRNNFPDYDTCSPTSLDGNLAPGETGFTASSGFANNPTGHDFKATIQLCTSDNQTGTCVAETITFVP